MNKIYLIIVALLALAACKKENNTSLSNGNIVLATGITSATVGQSTVGIQNSAYSASDSATVAGLMAANHLSTNGFVFYAYQSYNALNQSNQMALYQLATARQVRNGLAVFFMDLTFPFENGIFNEPYPAPQFIVGTINLDNKPNLALRTLRDTFIKIDNAREAYKIAIEDSTLVAQLGYYNLNVNQVPVGGTPNYIKAWYVHPQRSAWPQGYFRDDTGSVIFFTPLTHSGPVAP